MRARRATAVALVATIVLLLAFSTAGAQVIWGTCTSSFPNDPGFEGMWKYCLDIGWDTSSNGLSHSVLFIGLELCPRYCEPGYFAFPDPAGSGPGDGGCTAIYHGSFLCDGDPTMPGDQGPTLKFEYDEGIGCEPGSIGTATLCFYSMGMPSGHEIFPDYLGIKYATNTDTGDLEGVLPSCQTSPVEALSWGSVKAIYR